MYIREHDPVVGRSYEVDAAWGAGAGKRDWKIFLSANSLIPGIESDKL